MFTELKAIVSRNTSTLAQDVAGTIALVVMLIVSLNLPIYS